MQHSNRPESHAILNDRHDGQTLVEFAFVALLFFTLLFGIMEFSRALWTWNTIVQATRAGARYAVVEVPTSTDVQVRNFVVYHDSAEPPTRLPVLPGLNPSNVTVQYLKNDGTSPSPFNKYQCDVIQVSITGYTFNFIVPIFGSGITLPSFTTTLPLEGMGAGGN